MNKKLGFVGMLALALVFGVLFAACSNVTQVEGTVSTKESKASTVENVAAVKTGNGLYVIVTWDAAEDATSYRVVYQEKDKKTLQWASDNASNSSIYSTNDGSTEDNTDIDKWSKRITIGTRDSTFRVGITYRFGVMAESSIDNTTGNSDIVWTDYITVR